MSRPRFDHMSLATVRDDSSLVPAPELRPRTFREQLLDSHRIPIPSDGALEIIDLAARIHAERFEAGLNQVQRAYLRQVRKQPGIVYNGRAKPCIDPLVAAGLVTASYGYEHAATRHDVMRITCWPVHLPRERPSEDLSGMLPGRSGP